MRARGRLTTSIIRWWLVVAGAAAVVCAAATACEDTRPASAPGPSGVDERNALVQRYNALAARLEADNTPSVHARLSPSQRAELDADVVRAASSLHDAHRSLETTRYALPEQALAERLEAARKALDDAEDAVVRADGISGVPADGSTISKDETSGAPTMGSGAPDDVRTQGECCREVERG